MLGVLLLAMATVATAASIIWSRRMKVPKWKVFLVTAVAIYALSLIVSHVYEAAIEYRLNAHDLNADGVFSPDEQTATQRALMDLRVQDTGRTLLPITAIPFSVIWAAMALLAVWLLDRRVSDPR